MQSQLSKQKVGKACWNVLQGGEENADLTDGANDDIRCKGANTHNGGKGCVKGLLILQSAAVGSCIIKRHPRACLQQWTSGLWATPTELGC